MRVDLTDHEFNTVINALRVAAEVYASDAWTLRTESKHDHGSPEQQGEERMATQLSRQADEAGVLLARLEQQQ